MLILKDKNGVVICKAQSATETYSGIAPIISDKKTQVHINILNDRESGVTFDAIIDAFDKADISTITIEDENGEFIDELTGYETVRAINKTIQNGGMTIDVSLVTKVAME